MFADDPEMTKLLGGLARDNFCAPDGEERKAGILYRSLALAGEFLSRAAVPPDAEWMSSSPGPIGRLDDAHRAELT